MKKHWGIALALAAALLAFCAGVLIERAPRAGVAEISLMSVPEQFFKTDADKGKIDINTASAAELADLSGIGPVLARRIIEYRELNGPFEVPEQLLNVKGIGEKTLQKFRDMIICGGENEDTGG